MGKKKLFFTKKDDVLNGLFAYYPLVDDSDDVITGYNGLDTNVIYDVDGANFNGITSEINIGDVDDFSFTDGINDTHFTITFKVKFNVLQNSYLISKIGVPSPREWDLLYLNDSNEWLFRLFSTVSTDRIQISFNNTPVVNQEYYVAVTYNGANGMSLYIDNDLVGNQSEIGNYTGMTNTTQSVRIGKVVNLTSFTLDGSMKDIRFFNVEKTHEQIQAIGLL